MASGLGPQFILPFAKGWVGQLTGEVPDPNRPYGSAMDWFSPNVMNRAGQSLDYGALGGFTSHGPQSTQYQRPNFPLGADPAGAGLNAALFGSSYDPRFGQSAYDRFADAGDSYARRYATDLTDAQGRVIGFSPERGAGARSMAQFGGRNSFLDPLTGQEYGGHKEFAGLAALQQGANPFLNNPTLAAQMSQFQELGSPFARADPQNYLQTMLGAEGQYPSTGDIGAGYADLVGQQGFGGVNQMRAMAQRGYGNVTNDTEGLVNSYERDLMRQMAAEGSKDLSLGLQDAQNTMSAMGLGRSGQGQSTAGGMWRDIQERNALDRQNLMAQFAEAGMGREAQAMLGMGQAGLEANRAAILQAQQGGIQGWLAAQEGAIQGNESRLGRANQAAMTGLNALTGSLEASRAAERQQLLGGMDRTAQWNQGVQGNYLQSLLGHDQAALNRMVAESQEQSRGQTDYMNLQREKDAMRAARLNEMLGLEDRYRTSQNEVLNQMAQYSGMPINWIMSMITGISPTGGSPARTSPWGNIAGQLGGAALGAAPAAYSAWQNQYDPETAG